MNVFQDANSFDPQKLSESFRQLLPTDGRYVALTRQPVSPINAITEKGCEFRLMPTSDIILLNDIKIHMKIRLVTKDKPHMTPRTGEMVGPVNNVISSCISEVKILVNNTKGT